MSTNERLDDTGAGDQSQPFKIVVLVSGSGSNLQAIIDGIDDGSVPAAITGVISNVPDAFALTRATRAGLNTDVLDHRQFSSREEFDQALKSRIQKFAPDLVVMAGFMRILSDEFFDGEVAPAINIHPALLPDYKGLNTHARVIADGGRWHGASVHFVTPELDSGDVIIRGHVPVHPDDTPEILQARVLEQEHRIYPLAITWLAQGRLGLRASGVTLDGQHKAEQGLEDPQ